MAKTKPTKKAPTKKPTKKAPAKKATKKAPAREDEARRVLQDRTNELLKNLPKDRAREITGGKRLSEMGDGELQKTHDLALSESGEVKTPADVRDRVIELSERFELSRIQATLAKAGLPELISDYTSDDCKRALAELKFWNIK